MSLPQAVANGEPLDSAAMDVDPPQLNSSAHNSPIQTHLTDTHQDRHSTFQDRQNTHEVAVDFDFNTERIKSILAFGKELQSLYDSLTLHNPNEKLKVLLQVSVH